MHLLFHSTRHQDHAGLLLEDLEIYFSYYWMPMSLKEYTLHSSLKWILTWFLTVKAGLSFRTMQASKRSKDNTTLVTTHVQHMQPSIKIEARIFRFDFDSCRRVYTWDTTRFLVVSPFHSFRAVHPGTYATTAVEISRGSLWVSKIAIKFWAFGFIWVNNSEVNT